MLNLFTVLIIGGLAVMATLLLWHKPTLVIHLQIIYCCVVYFLISFTSLPSSITYLMDFFTVLLLAQLLLRWKTINRQGNIRKPLLAIIVLAFFVLLSVLVNLFDGSFQWIFFFWGLRIYGRMYIFFLACTLFLRLSDVERLLKMLIILLPVNAILCTLYLFVFGFRRDSIGGMFGTVPGCDGLMCVYLMMVTAVTVVWYIHHKTNLLAVGLVFALSLYISVLAELKVLFLALPLLMLIAFAFTPSRRAGRLLIIGILMTLAALPLFAILYPSFADFFNLEIIWEYVFKSSYGDSTSLNRLSIGGYILREIFTSIQEVLFGVGLGNADRFLSFQSVVYQTHGHLRYEWFMYSFLLLEVGVLGLGAYTSFFVVIFYDAWQAWRRMPPERRAIFQISGIMAMVAIFLMVYNSSFHSETGYFIFFILSIGYVAENEYAQPPEETVRWQNKLQNNKT